MSGDEWYDEWRDEWSDGQRPRDVQWTRVRGGCSEALQEGTGRVRPPGVVWLCAFVV